MILLLETNTILLPALIAGGVAVILGVVITLVFKFFAVKKNPLEEALNEILPGVNCGGCGYSGCSGYASALASAKEKNTSRCTAGGKDTADAIAKALGAAPQEYIPTVAHVFCQGDCNHTTKRYNYTGTEHCASATGLFAGPNSCTYGCLGFGDCYNACEFGAIYIEDGIAKVDHTKCTACGACVAAGAPFVNIPNYPDLEDVHARLNSLPGSKVIEAKSLAKESGNLKAVNMVMVGAASNHLPLSQEALEKAISALFARKGDAVVDSNIAAFRAGRSA